MKAQFNELAKLINRFVDDVNSGGCAVVAALVAQYMPINCIGCTVLNYIYEDDDDQDVENNSDKFYNTLGEVIQGNQENSLRTWNKNGILFSHVVATYMIDGIKHYFCTDTGLVTEKQFAKKSEYGNYNADCILPVEICKELGDNGRGWNPCFDREQIPTIERLVKKVFGSANVQVATV